MTAYIATFTDGYKRIIAWPTIKTTTQAIKYATDLEAWFKDSLPERILISVEVKK